MQFDAIFSTTSRCKKFGKVRAQGLAPSHPGQKASHPHAQGTRPRAQGWRVGGYKGKQEQEGTRAGMCEGMSPFALGTRPFALGMRAQGHPCALLPLSPSTLVPRAVRAQGLIPLRPGCSGVPTT